jgi:hypothetical protein
MSDKKKIVESKDYRTFFVNSFGIRFSDNDVALLLSTDTSDSLGDEVLLNEARVIMTPRTAKLLTVLLTSAITQYEKAEGTIHLGKEKEEEIAKLTLMKKGG